MPFTSSGGASSRSSSSSGGGGSSGSSGSSGGSGSSGSSGSSGRSRQTSCHIPHAAYPMTHTACPRPQIWHTACRIP